MSRTRLRTLLLDEVQGASKIGMHITGSQRNGYGPFCEARPAGIVSIGDGGALLEAWIKSEGYTYTVFRDISVYKEAPGDINNPPGTYKQMAEYWYPKLKAVWEKNPADYYTITNEQGGGGDDIQAYQNLVDYECAVMKLANADGFKVVVGNLATGGPQPFSVWSDIVAPLVLDAWRNGNLYGRHVYGNPLVDNAGHIMPGDPMRPMEELAYLQSLGGVGGLAITELGLGSGANYVGDSTFVFQITKYCEGLKAYPDIPFVAAWTLGQWSGSNNANCQSALPHLIPWMDTHQATKWTPQGSSTPHKTLKEFLWDVSVEEQIARGIPLNPEAGLQQWFYARDFNIVHREVTPTYEDEGYTIQAGENLAGTNPRTVAVWQPGKTIWSFEDPYGTVPPPPNDPLAGFYIGPPFRVPFVLTAPLNAQRPYGLHEGGDWDILSTDLDSKEPVLAGINGTVYRSRLSTGGFGEYVVLRTIYNGITVDVWYYHMDVRYVNEGDQVTIGTPLGELGDTGGNWAEHIHITVQAHGHGMSGYILPDIVDPVPLVDPKPAGNTGNYNMGVYFLPPGTSFKGDIFILRNNWGAGDERVQLQRQGSYSFITKGANYEKRNVGSQYIDLMVDTSPEPNKLYTVDGHWLPRYMNVGQTFKRIERVSWFTWDCQPLHQYTSESYIKFVSHHPMRTYNGIQIPNVIELHWIVNGNVDERYFYAAGLGLVEWRKYNGLESHLVELIPRGTQQDNVLNEINCT